MDTHLNLATISADRKHLDEVELVPFRAAIANGVDSVMTAHLAVPALGTGDLPATLSPVILTKLLREDLGFKGIVVTDALEMGGIAKGFTQADAAVRAIEAGADVLLMPTDPVVAIDAVGGSGESGADQPGADRAERGAGAQGEGASGVVGDALRGCEGAAGVDQSAGLE